MFNGFVISVDSSPKSMAYVLQADQLDNKDNVVDLLTNSARDLIVVDANYAMGERWAKEEIEMIRNGKDKRVVLAYLSIGEAEDYRDYWDFGADYLVEENPYWEGNYKVKYWDSKWQSIILNEVKKIIELGFDGVYVDGVDSFEYFEYSDGYWIDYKVNVETGNSYRMDMVNFVKLISLHSDIIIPNNGYQLLVFEDYRDIIDGQGIESYFYDVNKAKSRNEKKYVKKYLDLLDKPVFDIEYSNIKRIQRYIQRKSRQEGFVVLITDIGLSSLGKS